MKGKFDLDTVLRNYFASKNSLTKHQKLAGSTVGSYMLTGKSKAAFDKMKHAIETALLGQKLLGGKELTSIAFLFGANEFSSYELKGGQLEELSDEAKQIVNVSSISESVGGWNGKAPEDWINSALLGISMQYERLENEKMRLAKAKTTKEKELRAVWVKQIEKEISNDKDHIRKLGGDPDVASDMSVDELAADLEDFDIK